MEKAIEQQKYDNKELLGLIVLPINLSAKQKRAYIVMTELKKNPRIMLRELSRATKIPVSTLHDTIKMLKAEYDWNLEFKPKGIPQEGKHEMG